jgi:RimJ/RimL family protein N-acetyltransferase
MYELSRDQYYRAIPLLDNGHPHPEVQSILENNNPGWVFVDQADTPQTAFVWSKGMRGFYLIGDETNDAFTGALDDYITTSIAPRIKAFGIDYMEVSGHHERWNIHSIFASRQLHAWMQRVYMPSNFLFQDMQPMVNFRVVDLRSQAWREQDYRNRDFVSDHIAGFWETQEDFYEKGYGYAAIDGDQVVGVCYSSFVTRDRHAIGIETVQQHHKRGVGSCLANLVARDITRKGFSPYWDCEQSNEASIKVALRLGFERVHQYQCVGFSL